MRLVIANETLSHSLCLCSCNTLCTNTQYSQNDRKHQKVNTLHNSRNLKVNSLYDCKYTLFFPLIQLSTTHYHDKKASNNHSHTQKKRLPHSQTPLRANFIFLMIRPFKSSPSRRLIDRTFQEADEASKGAGRRPTARKGGAHAPPLNHTQTDINWSAMAAILLKVKQVSYTSMIEE